MALQSIWLKRILSVSLTLALALSTDSQLLAQGSLPSPYPNTNYVRPETVFWNLLSEYPNSTEDRKKQIVEQLTKLVQQEFDARHASQQQEIKALEEHLAQKKKAFEKREKIKEKIVADRVAALVERAEGTGWEPPTPPIPPMFPPTVEPSWMPLPVPPAPPSPAYGPPPAPIQTIPNSVTPSNIVNPNTIPPALHNPLAPPTAERRAPVVDPNAAPSYPKARVSYEDFKELVAEVEPHRQSRVLSLDQFLEMSKRPDVIILDTRSDFRFERVHIKGAKHLSFTDFTQANLANVIPSPDTTVLIYCNNNFDGNQIDFASKSAPPRPRGNGGLTSQIASQNKPVQLALNVPTYINLYGYGYQNVYELGELVKVSDPRIEFEGSIVGKDR